MHMLRIAVLVMILFGGLLAFSFVAEMSAHDDRLVSLSFIAGAIAARLIPWLWRWADRPE